ncbi:hypothetical protein N7516_004727 [Penicillium verrucosum]|uniref:uncharacterized protein n=1 Tax=Penicillium verrucosum TaxID=60171 RepID=UPI002545AD90|nr:uncharacterized protein N7516_004727 [Penicillium verrucosum]KAJ5944559.1 hypothetical protein N7516_004727 [Penicillium verrucosum]
MPKTNKEIEQQIQLAMDHLSEQSKPNISKTAREFAVPGSRLRRRWLGGKSLFQRQSNGRKLNPAQESALCEYIDHSDAVGESITRRQIAIAANSILRNDHADPTTDPPQIGDHWLQRFLKRNPEYQFSTPKAAEKVRKISHPVDQYDASTQRLKEGLAKFAKGAEAQATLALQLQREFDNIQTIRGARHAGYDSSRLFTQLTGIIDSTQVEKKKYKEYKLSEEADQEKTKRKWKKVLIEIRKHGRAKKRSVK